MPNSGDDLLDAVLVVALGLLAVILVGTLMEGLLRLAKKVTRRVKARRRLKYNKK